MKLEVASSIGRSLNHPKIMDAINDYINYRIEKLHEQMETAESDVSLYRLQGSITELKKMKTIRNDALAVIDTERKGNG